MLVRKEMGWVKYGRKRSQIVIECSSQKELDRIFTRLKNS